MKNKKYNKFRKLSLLLLCFHNFNLILATDSLATDSLATANLAQTNPKKEIDPQFIYTIKETLSVFHKLERRVFGPQSPFTDYLQIRDCLDYVKKAFDEKLSDPFFFKNEHEIKLLLNKSLVFVDYFINLFEAQEPKTLITALKKRNTQQVTDLLANQDLLEFKLKNSNKLELEEGLTKLQEKLTIFTPLAEDYGRNFLQKVVKNIEDYNKKNNFFKIFEKTSSAAKLSFLGFGLMNNKEVSRNIQALLAVDSSYLKWIKDEFKDKVFSNSELLNNSLIDFSLGVENNKIEDVLSFKDIMINEKGILFKIKEKGILNSVKNPIKMIIQISLICKICNTLSDSLSISNKKELKELTKSFKEKINSYVSKPIENVYKKMGGTIIERDSKDQDGWSKPRYTFDDIVGQTEIKEELERLILSPIRQGIKNDEPYTIPHGLLFEGISRSGKTFMAEALAGELEKIIPNFRFHLVTAENVMHQNYGFKWLIDAAKNDAPIIIFIDEIDLWDLNRDGNNKDKLNELLVNLSGLGTKNKKPVIVIGATNKIDKLDPALRQNGRFSEEIPFTYSTFEERKIFLDITFKKERISIDEKYLLDICKRLENQSFETVKSCINDAIHIADNCPPQYENFIQAIDNLVHGIKPYGLSKYSQEESEMAACYQVGKSFILFQNNYNKFLTSRITVLPVRPKPSSDCKDLKTIATLGEVFNLEKNIIESKNTLMAEVRFLVAGRIAQEVILDQADLNYREYDQTKSLEILTKIFSNGIDDKFLQKDKKEEIQLKAFNEYEKIKEEIREVLEINKDKIINATRFLLLNKTIDCKMLLGFFISEQELEDLLEKLNS